MENNNKTPGTNHTLRLFQGKPPASPKARRELFPEESKKFTEFGDKLAQAFNEAKLKEKDGPTR